MRKTLLRLNDGKAGHMYITDGVVEAIKQNYDFEIIDLQVKIRGKFLLQIMKLLVGQNWFDRCLKRNYKLLSLFYKNFTLPTEHIDLIISTGGDTSFINIWLSRILETKNVYCSGLRGLKPEYFHLLVSGVNLGLDYENLIYTEVIPNRNFMKDMSKQISEFCEVNDLSEANNYFVLLLGGDTGNQYEYSPKDWEDIINGFMYHVQKENAKALISTSRRTGLKNEVLIEQVLEPYQNDIAYTIYFNKKPEKLLGVILPLASKIFVTEESGTMIGESLYYRKPIFTVGPRKIRPDKKYNHYLDNLRDLKRIKSMKSYELKEIDLSTFEFEFMKSNPMDELANQLKPHLKNIL